MSALDKRIARLEAGRPTGEFDHLTCSQLMRRYSDALEAAIVAGEDLSEGDRDLDADELRCAEFDTRTGRYSDIPLAAGVRWPHTIRNLEWWEKTYSCRAT